MIKINIISSYDVVIEPGFKNAKLYGLISKETIKYFSNKFSNNYNGRGVIRKFFGMEHNYDMLINVIDFERNKKFGHKLDVLIVDDSKVLSVQTRNYFLDNYIDELIENKDILDIGNCVIEFTTNQKLKNQANYLFSKNPVDLVIFIDETEVKIREELRRNGEPLIKTIYCYNNYIKNFKIEEGFYSEDTDNWSDESYKMMLRKDKLERILKND